MDCLRLLPLFVTALLAASCACATTWHVSAKASAGGDGTAARPFATIGEAAAVMQAGDTCLVHAGTYRETVRPARSGESGRSLTFEAAPGERVIVSGADPVTGWRLAGGREGAPHPSPLPKGEGGDTAGHVYRAPSGGATEQLFLDGRMMTMARWPNAPLDPLQPAWALCAKGTGPNAIVDPKLPPLDLAGARLHILPGAHWVSWVRPVQGFDPAAHRIDFESNWGDDWAYKMQEGTRYYCFGTPALLDTPGEWAPAGGDLLLWSPAGDDPGRHRVEVKRRSVAFDLSGRRYIRIKGFLIFAAGLNLADAARCEVVGCHLRYASHFTDPSGWAVPPNGIVISGHDNVVRDSSVVWSAGNGITLGGRRNTVRNCLVRYADYMATDAGAVWMDGERNALLHCTLSHTGRSVLLHRTLRRGSIMFNDLHHAGLLTSDLGITYCFGTDGDGTVIAYNRVHDNQAESCGVGIYIDNNSSHFLIHHNVCYRNGDSGIRLNTASHDNLVYNNTATRNLNGTSYWGPDNLKDQAGCRMINNLFTDEMVTGEGIELSHNFVGKHPGFVNAKADDYRLRAGSPCINAALPIPAVTIHPAGKAPDIGAFEHGAPAWRAGHDWGEAPEF